jgi:hypothetical protein
VQVHMHASRASAGTVISAKHEQGTEPGLSACQPGR